jgi:splicing factor U2AF subunit
MKSSRDDRRGGDDRRRRRSRSPRHGGGGGGGGGGSRRDYEVDTYSSSRDYREREREDTYARRERRDDRGAGGDRGERSWGDSYSRRDRPRETRDRDDDRNHRRDRGDRDRGARDGGYGDDRRRGGRDGGFGGGRGGGGGGGGGGRMQKEESPLPNKAREPTPDLAPFTSILKRERRLVQWDIKPAGYENITAEQAKLSGMFPLPGAPRAAPMDPSKLAAFMSPSAGTATAAALAPNASKQSKRLYVHNLPSGVTSDELVEFFNLQLNGLNVVSGRDPCSAAHIASSKAYAALEFKTPEDATVALAMNGILMRDDSAAPDRSGLSIRRPKDYITPSADENAYSGEEVSSVVKDSPNKLSIVNIPTFIEEEQIRELVETMGKLNAFVLVKDTSSDQHRVRNPFYPIISPLTKHKGIAFCEYADNEVVDAIIEGLNDITLGDGNLKVSRATVGVQQTAGLDGGVGAISMLASATADTHIEHSRVVCLMNMVTSDELINDDDYEGMQPPPFLQSIAHVLTTPDIKEDVEEECAKYGPIIETKIPRPAGARSSLGVGKIYIKYHDTESAQRAIKALAGRQFSRRTVVATQFSEEGFDVDAW